MMLAACSGADKESETDTATDTETDTGTQTEKFVPEDEEVDYSAILGEWGKYLKSVGSEEKAVYGTAAYMFKDGDTDTTSYNVEINGYIAKVEKVEKAIYDGEKLVSPVLHSTDFYDLKTGDKILNIIDKGYDGALAQYASVYSGKVYLEAVIEVESKQWTNLGDEETPDWKYVTTYSYYDNTGKELAANLEEKAKLATSYGEYAIKIADKAYHCKDGEIILVTHANNVHAIPDFNIEYKGYRYSFYNTYDENRIQVLNESYELVADYIVPYYLGSYQRQVILENGDVYIHSFEYCDDDDEDYDFTVEGEKYRVWHIILSVTTGEATAVDAPFIIGEYSGLYTNKDTDSTGIELSGEYQYAEIVRIEDGKLADDVEFVILDNTLNEVATLPAILKNQTGLQKGLGDGKFRIGVDSVYGYSATYVADSENGTVTRYIDDQTQHAELDGGFISDGKMYNDDLEMIFDLKDVDSYSTYEGAILYTVTETVEPEESSETTDEPEDVAVTYVGYIDESGEFQKTRIGAVVNVDYIGDRLFVAETEDSMYLCNRLGNSLALGDSDTVVSVRVVASSDGVVVVRATNEYTSPEDYEVEYNYYIIK